MTDPILAREFGRWRADPVAFVRHVLVNPETGRAFDLFPAQERFLREALTVGPDGRLPYPELLFSAPKKSGKTTTAAMAVLYTVVVLGGPYGEGIVAANDLEQSTGRVFQAIVRIVEASPLLRKSAVITASKMMFPGSGGSIIPIANEYEGAAGTNPTIIEFDELWGYTSERSRRLWDELIPSPARQVSVRLTTTTAGFEGESALLEGLHERGLQGDEIAPGLHAIPGEMLMFWSTEPVAPWQTERWLEQMRRTLRPSAFIRMIRNTFVSGEEAFIPMDWWDACTDPAARPVVADEALPVWAGVDASTKRDWTAIVACAWDAQAKKVRLVAHRIFKPTPEQPLDFAATIVATLIDWHRRFLIREVRFDPTQMVAVSQDLGRAGLPMVAFDQTAPNLTEASQNLFDLIKGRNLVVYPDDEVRRAVGQAVAVETPRGWKISKEKQSHRVDVVVALAQAALGAVRAGAVPADIIATAAYGRVTTATPSPFESGVHVLRYPSEAGGRFDPHEPW